MKLIRFGPAGNERPGLWIEKVPECDGPAILDVRAMAFDIEDYNEHFFRTSGISRLANLVRESNRKFVSAENIRLGPPVDRPGKIICMGGNYAEHVRESASVMPANPVFFTKAVSSLTGPADMIALPEGSRLVDGEVELAFVIGKEAKKITASSAFEYIAGFTVLNDVSDREAQRSGGQWFRAKSADTFCPLGPFLVTTDELPDYDNLRLFSKLNGKILQDGNTSDMMMKIPEMLSFLSRTITLMPGDIVSTGTPSGIGSARTPPILLKKGDTLESEVEKVGRQIAIVK